MKQWINAMSIADRIRILIGKDTEAAFAGRVGVAPHVLGCYLEGKTVPDPCALVRISGVCKVNPEWLLRGPASNGAKVAEAKETTISSGKRAVPPPVNAVLNHDRLASVRSFVSNSILVDIVREEIQQWMKAEPVNGMDPLSEMAGRTASRAQAYCLPRRDCINATGIIIHTGWGNAPLHPLARSRVAAATGASPTGAVEALPRIETCARLLRALTGAEAATVTTLNAASLLLVAGALAAGREIIVAARDLVEISQGARISDILQAAGARVVSVGSANCVYIHDYARAITTQTAMLMRIRVSNMAASGYVTHVAGPELAALAQKNNLIYVDNLGGGSLVDLTARGLAECPTLQQGLAENAHLVLASGDKIIGGPQAGIIVGKKDYVNRISHHVLARTCRPAKLTLAALEATLAVYVEGRAWDEIPTLRLLAFGPEDLTRRAIAIGKALSAAELETAVMADTTECGGAVLPGVLLPTCTIRLKHPRLTEDQLYDVLLARGVVARRAQGKVILDLRSVLPEDDSLLLRAIVDSAEPADQ